MRYSFLVGRAKQNPVTDQESVNGKLLIQAGFIDQVAAGIYNFLPLGMRVMQKINNIIRHELNAIGCQEILMPALHPVEYWQTTGRDVTCDETLFKTEGHGEKKYFLGMSHEEMVTPLIKQFLLSYRDFPMAVYQIQTKFRNEARAKSGILRGREFGMKDLYSFHETEEDLDNFYEVVKQAYLKIFTRCGLNAYVVKASGGSFSDKYSHEFQVLTDAGEDKIYINAATGEAFNSEVMEKASSEELKNFKEAKGVEAGNIFKLGSKFTEDFGMEFTDRDGKRKKILMGCYGIGTTRLMGTIVEASHDEKGIIWPKEVAPFDVHLTYLGKDTAILAEAMKYYEKIQHAGYQVLFDDRDESAGKKLRDADLIGLPVRILISEKTLANGEAEVKERNKEEVQMIKLSNLIEFLYFYYKPN